MELKKKTIIWEDNTEPPKNYIWIKSDGKAYEFDYNDRKWKESQIVSSIDSGNGGGEATFDDVVKYYTGFSPDEVEDWKILQNADEHTTWPSTPFVKVSDSESDTFYDFIESESNYWKINITQGGAITPTFMDSATTYIVASVQYNKPSPI